MNKLELRYVFNEKSNYMDAVIRNRCEREILTMVRALADMLDVRLMAYHEPVAAAPDSYREVWAVAGENSRCISVILNLAMQVLARKTLSVGGQLLGERTEDDDLLLLRETALFRKDLKLQARGVPHRLVELLGTSLRFGKYKSNFFEAVKGFPKISKIVIRELNGNNRVRSGSLEVKRDQFDYYILRTDELPPVVDQKATIEIISPVLSDARYRWKGIYNKGGITIDFYMQDEDFKRQMIDDKIAFANGMCIDCVLEISRRLSELGEVVNTCYAVKTVVRTRVDKMEIITPQGRKHLRKLQAEREQLTLDFG